MEFACRQRSEKTETSIRRSKEIDHWSLLGEIVPAGKKYIWMSCTWSGRQLAAANKIKRSERTNSKSRHYTHPELVAKKIKQRTNVGGVCCPQCLWKCLFLKKLRGLKDGTPCNARLGLSVSLRATDTTLNNSVYQSKNSDEKKREKVQQRTLSFEFASGQANRANESQRGQKSKKASKEDIV